MTNASLAKKLMVLTVYAPQSYIYIDVNLLKLRLRFGSFFQTECAKAQSLQKTFGL